MSFFITSALTTGLFTLSLHDALPIWTEQLREAMARHRVVTVVQADVLQVPLPRRRFRVVANPPYTIAAELLRRDRKSTRLNSSHVAISYAVFCLKKKTNNKRKTNS